MKIGIESQRIFRKAKHGMDVVALELIRRLQAMNSGHRYILFARNDSDRHCLSTTANLRTEFVKGLTYADWEQVSLPAAVKRIKPDILHCTNNTAPLKCSVPMIVTIHDVIYLEKSPFGGSVYQDLGNLYRKMVVPRAIRNAARIITVSEYEKSMIVKASGVDPDKIVVIPNGVDKRFHPGYPGEQIETFRQNNGLPEKFILALGNTAPKKNTPGLIKSYVQYCSMTDNPVPIVITDFSQSEVSKILVELNSADVLSSIILPGYVPTTEMPLLYNCSDLFIYPSHRESFGLPVLEAMACGVPVIASQIPAINEVAGDSVIYIDPVDHNSIATAIHDTLSNEQGMLELKKKGLARASQFSWELSAKKLLQVYQSV